MDNKHKKTILKLQTNEITGREIYLAVAQNIKNPEKKAVLLEIADEETKHYDIYKSYTNQDVSCNKVKVTLYCLMSKLFGYIFSIKLLEHEEEQGLAKILSSEMSNLIADTEEIRKQEEEHEDKLIDMLSEERVEYISSIILGLNDALVEISGSLAGFTFAMQNTKITALAGFITGISATLSMAFSQYLAEKSSGKKDYLKSSLYTGVSYFFTVLLLICPYVFLPKDMYVEALIITLLIVVFIIFVFTYYISIVKSVNFKTRFFEMLSISIGVSIFSFILGIVAKKFLGIET